MIMMTKEFSSYEKLISYLERAKIDEASFSKKGNKWELLLVKFDVKLKVDSIEKTVIEYNLPIQSEEQCKKHNKMCREMFGENNFTVAKPTEEHIELLINQLYETIEKVGDDGGWYTGDSIKVKIELEYEPEDK
jgi:hypothetical protein